MYSWGDDTSDWKSPGGYVYDPSLRAARAADAAEASRRGPREYHGRSGPDTQRTEPTKRIETATKNPLMIAVDVTGSMAHWPFEIFDRLPLLYQTLSQYRPDLEISFAAIGDAGCDRWPLQVTEFTKGFSLEDNLGALYGEGGGGDEPESYGLFAQYVDRHVRVPNADRPFLIVFGDATMHPHISECESRDVLGDEVAQPASSIATWRRVSRTWNTWFLRRAGHQGDAVEKQWREAIGGDHVVAMHDEVRAVDYAMALVARSWGRFDDFRHNMRARQDESRVLTLAERVASLESAIELAKVPRVLDCPKCGAPLPLVAEPETLCTYCRSVVTVPIRALARA